MHTHLYKTPGMAKTNLNVSDHQNSPSGPTSGRGMCDDVTSVSPARNITL